MRVLHVIDHTNRYNGMVHAAIDLACQQSIEGDKVSIWSFGGEMGDLARGSGVELLTVEQNLSIWNIFSILQHTVYSIKRFKPDIIHAHMVRSAIIFWFVSRFFRVRMVTSVQNSFILSSVAMAIGDGVVTGCEAVRQTMRRRGISPHRMYAVLNGTADAYRLMHSSSRIVHLKRPALLTICGLHHRKGIDILISAFHDCQNMLPDLNLYIIGDGPGRSLYEKIVVDRDVKNVHFCGYVVDTLPYMKNADAFILASRADPAPLVISEARVAGMAVIASNVDGIPEMLDNSRAGILVEVNDRNAFAKAILCLFNDSQSIEYWRKKSQINIGYMSIKRVSSDIRYVYKTILQKKYIKYVRPKR